MRITDLWMTCESCPSQWEGRLANGRYLYIRFRWSRLEMGTGTTPFEAVTQRAGTRCAEYVGRKGAQWEREAEERLLDRNHNT